MTAPSPSRRGFMLILLTAPTLALVPLTTSAQVGRRYRIELVIFERLGHESRHFLEVTSRPLSPDLSGSGIGEGPVRPSASGFALQHVADRIEQSGQGRVLARLAWDQVGRDYHGTSWIRIQEGRYLGDRGMQREAASQPGPIGLTTIRPEQQRYELEGRLRVWVGQFLHLETDMIFHSPYALPDQEPDYFPAVRVRGSQRMSSGNDLFYVDHPVVGIIARVTRLRG